MISKIRMRKRARKKTNSDLVETLLLAEKNRLWELEKKLSMPARKRVALNIGEIDKEAKENENILVPGKVLGNGEISKKIRITALSFSSSAEEKLKKAKIQMFTIKEEIEKNKTLKGVRILG